MTEPQSIDVRAGALTFRALTWGEAGAPLALLVHGYPDTAWTWRHLGPRLAAEGWRVVAPFTRGYAPTDLAPDDRYFVADLVDDVLNLHTALGGDERAALIGHDWGSVATWGASAREPERFARYVNLAVPATPALLKPLLSAPRDVGLGLRQTRMSWYFLYNQLPVERTLDRMLPAHWRAWSPGYDATEDLEHLFASLHTHERRRAALRYYRNNLQRAAISTFSITPRAPALYLHGADDGCMRAEIGERYQDVMAPGSRFERVEGAGHWLHLERPEHVADRISAWLG